MSDINEVIKGVKAKLRMFPQAPALMLSVMEISSLITTIESLQNQVSGYKDVYHNEWLEQSAEKDALIESQKEEIDLLTEPLSEVVQTWVDACAAKDMEISKLESDQKGHLHSLFLKRQEIESLKAITELAVKGLKEIKPVLEWKIKPHDKDCICPFCDSALILKMTLAEIERLQNV